VRGQLVSIEQDMVAAYRDGVRAARVGNPNSDNPFDIKSDSPSTRIKAKMWVEGYVDGNPIPDSILDTHVLEVQATIVHVPAHARHTPHGIEEVSAYDYDRETGKRITPHPRGHKGVTIKSISRAPGAAPVSSSPSSTHSESVHNDAQSPGTPSAASGEPPAAPARAGFHVASQADHERLAKDGIKLPPAWTNVQVTDDPNAALQAVGMDSKGRSQYVYSSAHSEKQAAAKFARINTLRSHIGDIDHSISSDSATNDHAAALMLIRRLGLRPGSDSDTGAEKKAFGATNLRAGHVKVDGETVNLDFTGKKGVDLSFSVEDPQLAAMLTPRLAGKVAGDKVFATNERKTADYLHSVAPGFKLKDLRTYHGTLHAFAMVEAMPVPSNKAALVKARRAVAVAVSEKLGNTPTVALASYIDPSVFAKWEGVGSGEQPVSE
jgi:DNA topoisomerase I